MAGIATPSRSNIPQAFSHSRDTMICIVLVLSGADYCCRAFDGEKLDTDEAFKSSVELCLRGIQVAAKAKVATIAAVLPASSGKDASFAVMPTGFQRIDFLLVFHLFGPWLG